MYYTNWKSGIIVEVREWLSEMSICSGRGNTFYQRMQQYVLLWQRFYDAIIISCIVHIIVVN